MLDHPGERATTHDSNVADGTDLLPIQRNPLQSTVLSGSFDTTCRIPSENCFPFFFFLSLSRVHGICIVATQLQGTSPIIDGARKDYSIPYKVVPLDST
jgi:hypothetical protein